MKKTLSAALGITALAMGMLFFGCSSAIPEDEQETVKTLENATETESYNEAGRHCFGGKAGIGGEHGISSYSNHNRH